MSTVTNIVTTDIQDSVSNLYIAFFGRAPDAEGFGYWSERMAEGESVFKIAADFALSKEWVSNYGGLTPEQQVNLFYQNTFGRDADQEGLDYWVANIEGGLPFSTVAFQIINAAYLGGPDVDPNDNALVLNKIEVAQYFAITLKSNDTSLAATAFNGVTTDPATVTAAETRLDTASAESYTLTTGTDIIYGTDNDDVFQGGAVSTALIPAQTLNTSDNLNGGAGYNTLNAQLVDIYTAPAGLTNIQEINLSQPSSPISGLGLIPINALDLINANDTQVLGINGFASLSTATQIGILNVQTELNTINFSNIVNSGEDGFTVSVENTGTTLSGDADTLAINISNVSGGIGLDLYQSQDSNFGYETVNISATGGSYLTGTLLNLEDTNGTISTVNLTGNATNFDITGSGLSLDHLRTFNASTFTGDLNLEFTGAAVNADEEIQAVSVTGAEGDNDIFFTGTTANLTVTTFAGDDVVNVNTPLVAPLSDLPPAFTAFGDATINVGEGNNEVLISDLDGNVDITAGDGENLVDIVNVDGYIAVIAGDGVDNVDIATVNGNVNVDAGDGENDFLITGVTGSIDIVAGVDIDVVDIITVTGNVDVDAGDGDNDIGISLVTGDINVITGVGTNAVDILSTIGNVDVDAGVGIDLVNILTVTGDVGVIARDGENDIAITTVTGNVNVTAGIDIDIVEITGVTGTVGVDAGDGENDLIITDVTGDVNVTVGADNDLIDIITVTGNVDVNVGDGENDLLMSVVTGDVNVTAGIDNDIVVIGEVIGNVDVDAGAGVNDIGINLVTGNVAVTAGDGGNLVEISGEDLVGTITVDTGAGDDDLYLDTARFGDAASQGKGVDVDLGGGNNTLTLGGAFSGNVSFANATVANVNNLVVTTAVFVPGSFAATVDVAALASTLESVTFEQLVTVDAGGSITIDGAPVTSSLTFDKGANFDGLLQINDVQDLTLNVGLGTIGALTDFSFGKAGSFVAADLETLTINLDAFSTFTGATAVAGTDVNLLTSVTVNGDFVADDIADFTMDFDTDQSGAIETIDLSDFSGDAVVNVYSVTKDESFSNMDITIGVGNLDYSINDSSFANANQDEFIFTQDFGTVDIAGFEIGGSSTADILDLSVFEGITNGSKLIFDWTTIPTEMSISARNGEFVGTIVLQGTFDNDSAAVVAANNINYYV